MALTSSDLSRKCKISRQAIHRHLSGLMKEGKILKLGTSPKTTRYILNSKEAMRRAFGKERRFRKAVKAAGLHEDIVLKEAESQAGFFDGLSDDARINFAYGFTEMLNNAIEHSGTKLISLDIGVSGGIVSFSVIDTGVGIFQNICEKKKLTSELDALEDLLKGKQTTMPERHSGEGIFFTSKIADRLTIDSHRKRLTVDNTIDDSFVEDIRFRKGTKVRFELTTNSIKKLDLLFRKYTSEDFRFTKSRVKVKLFTRGELYISRSQAKRLVHALDQFSEIVLDFSGVETIGQAFADEVFRVFQGDHSDIKITAENCNENVDFMIRRARGG